MITMIFGMIAMIFPSLSLWILAFARMTCWSVPLASLRCANGGDFEP